MKTLRLTFLFLLVFAFLSGKGLGIIGGEITYEYIGVDTYQLHLNIYQDCNSSSLNSFTLYTEYDSMISYLWLFGDGGTSILRNPSYIFQSEGVYNPELKVFSNRGCSAGILKEKYINTYTLAIPEDLKGDLMIYPNPAFEKLYINSDKQIKRLMIYDQMGRLYFISKESIDAVEIDVRSFPAQLYILCAELEDGRILYKKVMIE